MAWVRYDDHFHDHHKVTAVIAEDPGAIALHTLANTWTNGQKRPGYIPSHQPGILLCDKTLGARWAALLTKHNLWHDVTSMCADCKDEYFDLPPDVAGYVVHNAKQYRAPERDRTTPGTPAELSEKRRAAGRKGGQAAAVRREQALAAERANADSADTTSSNLPFAGVSKSSNLLLAGVSPEPEPEPGVEPSVHHERSSDAVADETEDETGDVEEAEEVRDDVERVCKHLADRIAANGSKRPNVTKAWRRSARLMIDLDKRSEERVHRAIDWCQDDEFWRGKIMSIPKLRDKYDQLRLEAQRTRSRASPGGGGTPPQSDIPTSEEWMHRR